MTKAIPLLMGFILLTLFSTATRYFRINLDLRRLTLLVAVSFLLGYVLFYTAAWRLLISGVRLLACTSILGIAALLAGVLLVMREATGQR